MIDSISPRFAAAGVRSRVAQSIAGLRVAHRLDWIAHRFFFQEPPRSNRRIECSYSSARFPHGQFTNLAQQGYDRVLSMTDEDGERWLDEHQDRAEDLIWIFYALAVLSAIAIAAPIKWPKSSVPLVIAVILLGAVTLGAGGYIAYAGGKIRHREFRNEPAPPKRTHETNIESR